ncbi:MAG: DUF4835 family protein [Bacteroidales bacterium]|nr:DUF4835 family protein [Bacteroidales bacterium]
MKKLLFILLSLTAFCAVQAQEFNATVVVNYQKLLTTTQLYESVNDKKVFESMKQAIEDFVGGRHWTRLELEQHERIECSFSLILTQRSSATEFTGQLSVQMKRPVYNSTYTTGMFNHMEQANFSFTYNESQPLDFDLTNFYGNLQSTLAYYCYMMLGIYLDSYQLNGGEPMYDMAAMVAQTAEASAYVGWRATEGPKSRYWFVENHSNSAYAQLHSAYYKYHRLGLDAMTVNQEVARRMIIEALSDLAGVNKKKPNLLSVQQFVDVKIQELVSIFTPATDAEKQRVYDLVNEVSPINTVKIRNFNKK